MGKRRRFHPNFVVDLSSATRYYDAISSELGDRFRQSIREKLVTISQSPELFGKIREDVRGVRISKFPFILLYRVVGDMVVILGVKHAASDRAGWLSSQEER